MAERKKKFAFLEEWGKALIPERVRPHLRDYLLKAGVTSVNYKFFGALFYVCMFISIIFYFYLPYRYLSDKSTGGMSTLLYLGFGSFVVVFAVLMLFACIAMLCVYF